MLRSLALESKLFLAAGADPVLARPSLAVGLVATPSDSAVGE